jgi:outer membrane protein assembly factor BamB
MPRSPLSAVLSLSVLAFVAAAGPYAAYAQEDWPQWRGPNRDDVSTEKNLLQEWPEEGPKRLWMFENAGVGYSGPAIVGDRLFTMGARDGKELLLVLEADTGKEVRAVEVGDILENNWGDGPRGTPTVDEEFVYALGAQGNLVCVEAKSGDVKWKKSMQDLGGAVPTWGFTESPLVFKNMVVCTPGGEQGAIAALDKKTGELLWQTKDIKTGAHYSSIVVRKGQSGPELVQLLADQVVGLNPQSGNVLWSSPWPGRVAVIPTPIVKDNLVYVTSGYGVGCKLLEIIDGEAKEVYENKVMKNHHGGVILIDEHVYGHSDDVGWVCQDLKTGDRVWREREALKKGAIAYADGRFYCVGEDTGDVVLIEASTEGWKEHGRFTLDPQTDQRKPAGKIWTHPVIHDGKLYLRDQNLIYCYDVAAAEGNEAGN